MTVARFVTESSPAHQPHLQNLQGHAFPWHDHRTWKLDSGARRVNNIGDEAREWNVHPALKHVPSQQVPPIGGAPTACASPPQPTIFFQLVSLQEKLANGKNCNSAGDSLGRIMFYFKTQG